MSKYKTILLFGAPGAGKGTQGSILGRIPGFFHFSCGDAFRALSSSSEMGRVFLEYSSRGELVPDEVVIKMWTQHISARKTLGDYTPEADILVLDGIPRTLEQAELMDAHLEVLKIIHLTCDDQDEMVHRLRRRALKENRLDDADEKVIRKRWEVYKADTAPVLGHYLKAKIAEVNSLASPASVLRDILDIVVPIQEKHFRG